jgi:hypothetical protein
VPEAPHRIESCISCGYLLGGLEGLTCPECGYTLTPDDLAYDARRRAFLDVTRFAPIFWSALLVVGALVAGRWPLVPVLWNMLGGWLLLRHMPGLRRRLFLRIWMMTAPWLTLPWLVIGLAVRVLHWMYWETGWLDAFNVSDGFMIVAIWLGAVTALLAPVAWRSHERRLCRTVGLWTDEVSTRSFRRAFRVVYAPVLILALGWVVTTGILTALDALLPFWWTYFSDGAAPPP